MRYLDTLDWSRPLRELQDTSFTCEAGPLINNEDCVGEKKANDRVEFKYAGDQVASRPLILLLFAVDPSTAETYVELRRTQKMDELTPLMAEIFSLQPKMLVCRPCWLLVEKENEVSNGRKLIDVAIYLAIRNLKERYEDEQRAESKRIAAARQAELEKQRAEEESRRGKVRALVANLLQANGELSEAPNEEALTIGAHAKGGDALRALHAELLATESQPD